MIVLDLDNTIANDSWRIQFIDWDAPTKFEQYHAYHQLSAFDEVGNDSLFWNRRDVAIFTARPIHYHALTKEWLKRKGIACQRLFMRPEGNELHSRDLKEAMLVALMNEGVKIDAAYDDRSDVVEMFQQYGIAARCVRIHDVCAYTNPKEKK